MAHLVVAAVLWWLAFAMSSVCGARNRGRGFCRSRGRGWLVRCDHHTARLFTLGDLGALLLFWLGFEVLVH